MAPPPCPPFTERQAFLALNAVPGLGPSARHRLLERFGGNVRAVWRHCRPDPTPEDFDPIAEEAQLRAIGADFLVPSDPDYPPLLREIPDPPLGLYRQGRHDPGRPCVAIVGTRWASPYGREVARKLAAELCHLGFCVVSGLALGIDTAAHEGALAAGGPTTAVLGAGLAVIYPPENADLARRLTGAGALLSEFPLARRPTRQSFPLRNRVVSGLCSAVVVVESAVDGGAMITARFAGEQGRTVLAVPGRIDVATSAGCHQLLRDGAALLGGVEDILAELSYGDRLPAGFATAVAAPSRAHQRAEGPADGTTPEERALAPWRRSCAPSNSRAAWPSNWTADTRRSRTDPELTGRPGHLALREQMNVEMGDTFTRIRPVVDHEAIAVGQLQLAGHGAGGQQQMPEHSDIRQPGLVQPGNGLLGNDQQVDGRLRLDVVDDDAGRVLVLDFCGDFAGDDALKEGFAHGQRKISCSSLPRVVRAAASSRMKARVSSYSRLRRSVARRAGGTRASRKLVTSKVDSR